MPWTINISSDKLLGPEWSNPSLTLTRSQSMHDDDARIFFMYLGVRTHHIQYACVEPTQAEGNLRIIIKTRFTCKTMI